MHSRSTEQIKTLAAFLTDDPKVAALKEGRVRSSRLRLAFSNAADGYRQLATGQEFDCGDLPIGAFLQARSRGHPLLLMPVVITGRFHHDAIFYNPARGLIEPGMLEGKRIGVNAYVHTSGIWLRGLLESEFGLDPRLITWVALGDSYVAGCRVPNNCEQAPVGASLKQMLLDGTIDAAILGPAGVTDKRFAPVFPDATAQAQQWRRKFRAVPINHMLVIRRALCECKDLVSELYALFVASRQAMVAHGAMDDTSYGTEEIRRALELIVDYAVRQEVIPRPLTVDDLFGEVGPILSA